MPALATTAFEYLVTPLTLIGGERSLLHRTCITPREDNIAAAMIISTVLLMTPRYRKLLAPSRYAAKSPYRNLCLTPHSTYSTLNRPINQSINQRVACTLSVSGVSVRAVPSLPCELHAGTHSTASNLPVTNVTFHGRTSGTWLYAWG